MKFVETMGYVHRDLAARNVLVAAGGSTVKLADFGLSRGIVNSEYYQMATSEFQHEAVILSPQFWGELGQS